jgi:positive regulator of sigma E activity
MVPARREGPSGLRMGSLRLMRAGAAGATVVREVTAMTNAQAPTDQPGLREQAVIRLRKKSELRAHLLAYVLVNAFLLMIWALTGSGFFWPAFPLAGWGIGLAFHAWDVYRKPFSEDRIRHEMEQIR